METVPLVAQMGIARLPNVRFAPKAAIAYQPMNKRGRLTNDLSFVPGNVCLLRSAFLNGGRGLSNYVDNDIRLREHRHVAARHLGDGRSHAL
jgi:hypothetical protein